MLHRCDAVNGVLQADTEEAARAGAVHQQVLPVACLLYTSIDRIVESSDMTDAVAPMIGMACISSTRPL